MKLSQILNGITNINFTDCEIKDITLDSRKATENFLFCAIKGHKIDAREFIDSTITNNVTAILADSETSEDSIELRNQVQIIYIHKLNAKLSKIADNFYKSPSLNTNVVGITGTNGKTTISQLIAQWVTLLEQKAATMGTIGNGIFGKLTEAENTTGSALDIQKNLASFVKQKAQVTTMEISSHGLVQNRIDALNFGACVFTNLTQDHLDYHKTMSEYFKAKALLFTKFKSKYNIINIDDSYGLELTNLIEDKSSIIAISKDKKCKCKNFKNYICVNNIEYSNKGTSISFYSNFGDGTIETKLIGPFNVYNVLQSMATMLALGFNKEDIYHTAKDLSPVVGRMEIFKKTTKLSAIVDYAHTPDALEKALQAARIHTKANLWCIFGCGGDRDVTKRPIMAKIAEEFSDKPIITNDNPRTEDEKVIIKDMLEGINNKDNVEIIPDRFTAIEFAIKNAKKGDIILIAGKGHEDYQIIGTEKTHYSDRESVQTLLKI